MDFTGIMGFAVDTMAVVEECYSVEILVGVKESKRTHVWSLHNREEKVDSGSATPYPSIAARRISRRIISNSRH